MGVFINSITSTCVAEIAGGYSIHAALSGKPDFASLFGGGALALSLFALRFAIQEVTARTKPQTPCTSPSTRKDTRPTL